MEYSVSIISQQNPALVKKVQKGDVKTQAEDLIASVQKSKQSVTPKVSESNI